MTWRGSASAADRIFGALAYVLPLIQGIVFGFSLIQQLPILGVLLSPLAPLFQLYYSFPFAGLIVFFALFFFVVRNENVSHFIRFNTLQAILIGFIVALAGLALRLILAPLGGGFVVQTLSNTIFLGVLVAAVYGIAQSLLGRYAEIPSVSQAVYMQLR